MKKSVFYGGNHCIKGAKDLQAGGIDVCVNACYIPEENGRVEQTNRIIKSAMRTVLLLYSGASANLWTKYLYALFHALNRVNLAGRSITPEEFYPGVKSTVGHIRAFRCEVLVSKPDETKKTLEAKAAL